MSVSKISVCFDHCVSYERSALQVMMQKHLDTVGISGDFSGKKVLLKPNLISASAPPLACSNPEFVAAVASCFLERGAKVFIGDSPAFGSGRQVLQKQGFVKALAGLDVSVAKFRRKIRVNLDCGLSVTVAADALECDFFVNIPRIKAHEQMGVTMALKNVFGIVLGARKAWLHMSHGTSQEEFSEIILDLHKLLPSALVIADGIEVMNKRGPIKGSPLVLGCLAVSENFVALDRAMLDVLEVKKKDLPLALAAEKQGLAGAVIEDICFPAVAPSAFAGSGFRIPQTLSPIRFQPFRYLRSSVKRLLTG